jgi:hypothetical protein
VLILMFLILPPPPPPLLLLLLLLLLRPWIRSSMETVHDVNLYLAKNLVTFTRIWSPKDPNCN